MKAEINNYAKETTINQTHPQEAECIFTNTWEPSKDIKDSEGP